jgi:hypothetical protein
MTSSAIGLTLVFRFLTFALGFVVVLVVGRACATNPNAGRSTDGDG